ncbi:MAG: SIMPL domain-containing protein [Candidatus Omnitrophica bacterium]|nr:SIMPL domain-containing protein [Candidatus Omnitrophota bacterium]MDD5671144.1 SIMPL domain-containing protein [Candidatus Omnitrophota bacterium]
MEGNNLLKNSQIIVLGVCIALATLGSSVILSQALVKIKKFSTEVISVTGSAEKKIKSDAMVWRIKFSRRDLVMTQAYQKLQEDLATVKAYLIAKGIAGEQMILSPVETEILYRKNKAGHDTNEIEAYRLSQSVEIRSNDVDRVTAISRESTELINQGIELISSAPEYFYTKIAELKLEMLAEATQNAKKRAEQMAVSTGNRIGFMRAARMGVFQITPVNSVDVSDWGENDTRSLEKKVMAVVKVDFGIVE